MPCALVSNQSTEIINVSKLTISSQGPYSERQFSPLLFVHLSHARSNSNYYTEESFFRIPRRSFLDKVKRIIPILPVADIDFSDERTPLVSSPEERILTLENFREEEESESSSTSLLSFHPGQRSKQTTKLLSSLLEESVTHELQKTCHRGGEDRDWAVKEGVGEKKRAKRNTGIRSTRRRLITETRRFGPFMGSTENGEERGRGREGEREREREGR